MLHLSDALLPVSLLSYRHLFYILDFFVISVYNIITLETIRSRTSFWCRTSLCTCTCCSTCLLIHLCEQFLCALHQFFLRSFDLCYLLFCCVLRSRFCKDIFQCLNVSLYSCFLCSIDFVANLFDCLLCLEYHSVCFVSCIDCFFTFLILSLEFSCFFYSFIDIVIRHIRTCCDCNMLLFTCSMRLYQNEDLGQSGFHTCCSAKDVEDAAEVAFQLDIPFEVVNYTEEFREKVIAKFIETYEAGGTPNPCIDCNRTMKFDKMLDFAREHGLDYVVTGHYARIEQDPATGRWLLKKALYTDKDQSYVLYVLTQDQLAHTKFPLGGMDKPSIRKIAEEQGFCNARKHDSQDICFVPDGDYVGFMERYTGKYYPDGDFLDVNGNVVGRHHGAVRYTCGQRKGLGLALGAPVYVCGKDMEKNTVTVGPESELFKTTLIAGDFNWISVPELTAPMRVKAKARYRQVEQPATAYPLENGLVKVVFDEPQRAITRGQAVVLYDGDVVVGGGTIL